MTREKFSELLLQKFEKADPRHKKISKIKITADFLDFVLEKIDMDIEDFFYSHPDFVLGYIEGLFVKFTEENNEKSAERRHDG